MRQFRAAGTEGLKLQFVWFFSYFLTLLTLRRLALPSVIVFLPSIGPFRVDRRARRGGCRWGAFLIRVGGTPFLSDSSANTRLTRLPDDFRRRQLYKGTIRHGMSHRRLSARRSRILIGWGPWPCQIVQKRNGTNLAAKRKWSISEFIFYIFLVGADNWSEISYKPAYLRIFHDLLAGKKFNEGRRDCGYM